MRDNPDVFQNNTFFKQHRDGLNCGSRCRFSPVGSDFQIQKTSGIPVLQNPDETALPKSLGIHRSSLPRCLFQKFKILAASGFLKRVFPMFLPARTFLITSGRTKTLHPDVFSLPRQPKPFGSKVFYHT